jgi:hypothetical protein
VPCSPCRSRAERSGACASLSPQADGAGEYAGRRRAGAFPRRPTRCPRFGENRRAANSMRSHLGRGSTCPGLDIAHSAAVTTYSPLLLIACVLPLSPEPTLHRSSAPPHCRQLSRERLCWALVAWLHSSHPHRLLYLAGGLLRRAAVRGRMLRVRGRRQQGHGGGAEALPGGLAGTAVTHTPPPPLHLHPEIASATTPVVDACSRSVRVDSR